MKTVFITGATKNTGLEIARLFAEKGYSVALTGRDIINAENTAKKLSEEFGVKAVGYALDITHIDDISKVFKAVEEEFGTIDTFVANGAHLGVDRGFMNTIESDFDEIIATNIKGTYYCCRAAAEIMKKHGSGSIVTMGSVQATGAVKGRCVYSMTKAAISAMVKNMAFELGRYNIRANNVVAGAIHTSRWDELPEDVIKKRRSRYPLGRESTQREIANAVYYLGSELSTSVTGTDLTIDSGVLVCILPYEEEK